jgi:hypothetical protein
METIAVAIDIYIYRRFKIAAGQLEVIAFQTIYFPFTGRHLESTVLISVGPYWDYVHRLPVPQKHMY